MEWCIRPSNHGCLFALCDLTWLYDDGRLLSWILKMFVVFFFFSAVLCCVYSWLTTWLATLWKSNSRDSETSPDLLTPCRAYLGNSQDLANGFLTTTCLNQWPFENHSPKSSSGSGSCLIYSWCIQDRTFWAQLERPIFKRASSYIISSYTLIIRISINYL